MVERREHEVFSKDGDYCYRIFRSYDNKEIVVIEHEWDVEASEFIVEIVGKGPKGYAYVTKGKKVDGFKVHEGWSNKNVVEFVESIIADSYFGRF